MSFEEVMTAVSRWMVATEALAALGAELKLAQTGEPGHPDVARGAAARAVSAAADLPGAGELARAATAPDGRRADQDVLATGAGPHRRSWPRAGVDLHRSGHPRGVGRGSMMVPGALASAPELAGIRSFLDVGTGVGLLAIAAARTWPDASVTGIDIWEPCRDSRRELSSACLGHRVTLRRQDVAELADEGNYAPRVLVPHLLCCRTGARCAVPRLVRSLRPGGWLVLGRMAPPPSAGEAAARCGRSGAEAAISMRSASRQHSRTRAAPGSGRCRAAAPRRSSTSSGSDRPANSGADPRGRSCVNATLFTIRADQALPWLAAGK